MPYNAVRLLDSLKKNIPSGEYAFVYTFERSLQKKKDKQRSVLSNQIALIRNIFHHWIRRLDGSERGENKSKINNRMVNEGEDERQDQSKRDIWFRGFF